MLSVEKVRRIEKLRKADALTLARARESYEASYVALLVRCLEAGAFLPCETHDRARAIFAAVRGTEVDAKGHLDP